MELLTREVMRSKMDGSSLHASVNQVKQICEHCSGQHAFEMCPFVDVNNLPMEQAQVVGSFPRYNNPYSNTYNPGWRNHPNFSWRNDQQGQGMGQGIGQGQCNHHSSRHISSLISRGRLGFISRGLDHHNSSSSRWVMQGDRMIK